MESTSQTNDDIRALLRELDIEAGRYRTFDPISKLPPRMDSTLIGHDDAYRAVNASGGSVDSGAQRGFLGSVDSMLSQETREAAALLRVYLRVFSVGSGVGATTVVANLARLAARQGKSVVAVDESEDSLLPFHFGARRARHGLATFAGMDGEVHVLTRPARTATDATPEEWIARELEQLNAPPDCILVKAGRPTGATQGASAAISVAIVAADPNSIYRVPTLLESLNAVDARFVLNRFDPSDDLHRNIRTWLSERFVSRLAPVVLRRDELTGHALSLGKAVVDYAPDCGLSRDLQDLNAWLDSCSRRLGPTVGQSA